MALRVVFIGSVKFSQALLSSLLTRDEVDIVGIVSCSQSTFNADFACLESTALQHHIPYFAADKDEQLIDWVATLQPDFIFCFGWSKLLKQELIDLPTKGVLGYHPTLLPKHRGRHPIIWALALGLSKTGSTFFFIDGGVDSGDILSQREVSIATADTADDLYKKILDTALAQLNEFIPRLYHNNFVRIPQAHHLATYWRKRSPRDGAIDWRMSASSIYNLVRALTRPYCGAHYQQQTAMIKIWRSQIEAINDDSIEPGKILHIEGNELVVKCGQGAIRLLEHDFKQGLTCGDYL